MKTNFFIVLGLFIFSLSAFTGLDEWRIIGERSVKFTSDKDVIRVGGNDVYTKLKIKVVDAPIHIADFDVFFENGEKLNVDIRANIREGGESRVIDLPGGERRIDRIEFRYRTTGRVVRGTANVIVLGKR